MTKHEIKLVTLAATLAVVVFGIAVDGYFGFPFMRSFSIVSLYGAIVLTLGILGYYLYRFLIHANKILKEKPPAPPTPVVHIVPRTPEQNIAYYAEQIRTILLILLAVTLINSCSTCESIKSIDRAVNSTWEIKPSMSIPTQPQSTRYPFGH